jgi:ParB/RepB/Spo0J family partition protein
MMEMQTIELSKLHESKTNPRTTFDKAGMADLVSSIKEKGILIPLIVRSNTDGYEIVAGSRRYRAAKEAKLLTVPCIVRGMKDEEVLEVQLIENLQREDVHPVEEAEGLKRLQKEYGYSIEQLATSLGKKPWHVQQTLKYIDLIEPVRKLFLAREISGAQALLVARLQPDQQKECVPWLKNGWSAGHLKDVIERRFFLILKDAPFDIKDAKLVPKAGACTACPKRTGFNKLLFPDVKDADTCTDPECYESKVRAFVKIQVGTHPDAILLSIGNKYDTVKEPKGTIDWMKAGDKNCPDTKEGIVVEQITTWPGEKQKAHLGQVLNVCTNLKCKTHNPREVSDYDSRTGHSKTAIKARKVELRRRAMIFKELAAKPFIPNFRDILDWQIQTLSHDTAKAFCDAMGLEPKAAKHGGKDYQDTVATNLKKVNDVDRWIYILMLAEKDLWFYSGSPISKNTLLETKAKAAGVPVAEINKQAKAKPQPKAKAKKEKKNANRNAS